MSKKIIHLSDLHFKTANCDEVNNFRTIIEILKSSYGNPPENILIVITGDIADGAQKKQFQIAAPLIDELDTDNMTVWPLPGNHDYAPDGIIGNAKVAKRVWGDPYHSYYFKYKKKFIEEFEANIIKNRKLQQIRKFKYPQILSLDDPKILLIGLNSTNIEEIDFKGGQGGIGRTQMDDLKTSIKTAIEENPGVVVILMLHHHPFKLDNVSDDLWHQLVNGDPLMTEIKDKIDVLLFGHEDWHFYNSKNKINGKDCGIPHIFSCSNSTSNNSRYMKVTNDGRINWHKTEKRGNFGWEIGVEQKNSIEINMLEFDLQNNKLIKTPVS